MAMANQSNAPISCRVISSSLGAQFHMLEFILVAAKWFTHRDLVRE
jgi:hypothetical protein